MTCGTWSWQCYYEHKTPFGHNTPVCSSPSGTSKGLFLAPRTHKPPVWAAAPLCRAAFHCRTARSRQTQTLSPALQGTLTMATQTQPLPRQTGGISKAEWRHPRDPDRAAESWMLKASVSQHSPALISSWLKLHWALDMLCYSCHGPLVQGTPHSPSVLQRCASETCLSHALVVPFSLWQGVHAVCGGSKRRTPFAADQDTLSAVAWPYCECGRVWYQMAQSSAQLLELTWAQGELPFPTQSRERGREAALSVLHFQGTWVRWWDAG